jgi:hypothetical protein
MSGHQNAERCHHLMIANDLFENVAKFKYFVKKITKENCIKEEVKSRLNMGNACYRSFWNI